MYTDAMQTPEKQHEVGDTTLISFYSDKLYWGKKVAYWQILPDFQEICLKHRTQSPPDFRSDNRLWKYYLSDSSDAEFPTSAKG